MAAVTYIQVSTPPDAKTARQAVCTVVEALGIAHAEALVRVLHAQHDDERMRRFADVQKMLAAQADLVAIELYLHAQEQKEKGKV